MLVLYAAKGEDTYKNFVENSFFYPFGYNYTLHANHKQIGVILFAYVTYKKRIKYIFVVHQLLK